MKSTLDDRSRVDVCIGKVATLVGQLTYNASRALENGVEFGMRPDRWTTC